MGFIEGVEERALPIRQAILEHPFVQGIGQGDLDVDRFKFYVAQDYVYLIDYARALALGAARAPELEVMSWFASLLDETLNTEMELHRGYCAQFGISREELEATKAAPTTVAYTGYLLRVASQGSFGELAASLLPCQWGYWEIGEHLARRGAPVHAPLYAEWVGMYSSDEFRDLALHLRGLTNGLGNVASHRQSRPRWKRPTSPACASSASSGTWPGSWRPGQCRKSTYQRGSQTKLDQNRELKISGTCSQSRAGNQRHISDLVSQADPLANCISFCCRAYKRRGDSKYNLPRTYIHRPMYHFPFSGWMCSTTQSTPCRTS